MVYDIHEKPKSIASWFVLSFQHVFAMFGATILVPIIVGLNPLTALFTAGIGTLLFIAITGAKVPMFLGSSFAFIPALIAISSSLGWSYAMGGAICVGLFYIIIASIIKKFGTKWFDTVFPPVVIGSVIISIGLYLAPVAVNMAMTLDGAGNGYSLVLLSIAAVSLAATIFLSVFSKGFFKIIPILGGIIVGYVFTLIMGQFFPAYNLINFSIVASAPWLNFPQIIVPQFSWAAIVVFLIVSIATMIEHFGDVYAVSSITNRELFKDPGVHRTLIGDGLATSFAALFGGPPNTSYGENVGVLSITKVYSVWVIGLGAIIAIVISFFGKFGAVIQTIPTPVLGGVCMLLFSLIAASGLRMLVKNGVDYSDNKNLCVTACILAPSLGGLALNAGQFSLSGVALGAVLGIVANLIVNLKK